MSRRSETIRRGLEAITKHPNYEPSESFQGSRGRKGSLRSQRHKKEGEVADGIQKEYITNLQQQIYFLELELRLLWVLQLLLCSLPSFCAHIRSISGRNLEGQGLLT